jgi:hypothetical protein
MVEVRVIPLRKDNSSIKKKKLKKKTKNKQTKIKINKLKKTTKKPGLFLILRHMHVEKTYY